MSHDIQSTGSASGDTTSHVPRRRFAGDALHVFSLTSLVIAQNFYDRLAHQAEYLVDPEVTPTAIVWVVVVISVVLPSLIVGIEGIAGLFSRTLRESTHFIVVLILSTLLSHQVLQRAPYMPGWVFVACALTLACLLTWSYDRFAGLRSVVTLASPGVAIFPAILWMRLTAADASIAHRAIHDASREAVPVVFVVLDEFCGGSLQTPGREIDETRFPNFAALQQCSTWYRSAASVSPTTVRALPAILTGNYTTKEYTQPPQKLPQNLFSLVSAASGHEVVAFEPISVLAPHRRSQQAAGLVDTWKRAGAILNVLGKVCLYDVCPIDFQAQLPQVPTVWFGLHDSRQVDHLALKGTFRYGWTNRRDEQFDHFLRCIDGTLPPTLFFGHFLIPHAPWCYFPTGTRYAEDRDSQDRMCLESDGASLADELGVVQNHQRHLLQVMYVDQQLGRLMLRLKEVGLWDRCLLIVTADHGVSFRLGEDRREYSGGNSADILSIPLFIKYPSQQVGETNDLLVQSTDLLPTVMDVLGIQPAAPTVGISARDPRIAGRQNVVVQDPLNHHTFPPEIIRQSSVPALIRERFGQGSDRWNLFRIGPHSDWLGLPVDSLSSRASPPVTMECLLPLVSPTTGERTMLPYYIEGRMTANASPDESVELVAAVDGIICGTTRTYRQFGFQDRWSVMLPEWSYSAGAKVPEFFAVNQDGSLTPCQVQWVESFGESSETSAER